MRQKTIDAHKLREYPIVRFWYTKYSGMTIEEIIDNDYNTDDGEIKIKGIIEEEAKIYKILIKTNICKKE